MDEKTEDAITDMFGGESSNVKVDKTGKVDDVLTEVFSAYKYEGDSEMYDIDSNPNREREIQKQFESDGTTKTLIHIITVMNYREYIAHAYKLARESDYETDWEQVDNLIIKQWGVGELDRIQEPSLSPKERQDHWDYLHGRTKSKESEMKEDKLTTDRKMNPLMWVTEKVRKALADSNIPKENWKTIENTVVDAILSGHFGDMEMTEATEQAINDMIERLGKEGGDESEGILGAYSIQTPEVIGLFGSLSEDEKVVKKIDDLLEEIQ